MKRKALAILGLLCCVCVVMPASAFCWSQATHAYIADNLGARAGHDNLDEMWGIAAPDFFNYIFDTALCPTWISDQTHGTYADTFLKVWNAADTDVQTPLAYGFVGHNQQWGADYVAHVSGLRPGYESDGYIIIKARQLLAAPVDPAKPQQTFGDAFESFGMGSDMALLLAHVIIEDAIDMRLGKEVDPMLGRKLATAARNETKKFQPLLVKAFAADYAAYCFGGDYEKAAFVLTAAEKGHRKDMIFLGEAISQSEPVAAQMLAEQLVAVLSDMELSVPVDIVKTAVVRSEAICDDYKDEIDATIAFVEQSMKDHGITYQLHPKNK